MSQIHPNQFYIQNSFIYFLFLLCMFKILDYTDVTFYLCLPNKEW